MITDLGRGPIVSAAQQIISIPTHVVFSWLLAGCGGGEEGLADLGTTRPIPSGSSIFAGLVAEGDHLDDLWDGEPFTAPATLPISGSATFEGAMLMAVNVNAVETPLAGKITAVANFGAGDMSVNVANIHNGAGQAYSGALAATGISIDRAASPAIEPTFVGTLSGRLTGPNTLQITAQLSGDFIGTGYVGIKGVVDGAVTTPGGAGLFYGGFWAD